jgi:hypothetical protein
MATTGVSKVAPPSVERATSTEDPATVGSPRILRLEEKVA